ncbi:protein of unknown function [Pseudomonas mediterranea]
MANLPQASRVTTSICRPRHLNFANPPALEGFVLSAAQGQTYVVHRKAHAISEKSPTAAMVDRLGD